MKKIYVFILIIAFSLEQIGNNKTNLSKIVNLTKEGNNTKKVNSTRKKTHFEDCSSSLECHW